MKQKSSDILCQFRSIAAQVVQCWCFFGHMTCLARAGIQYGRAFEFLDRMTLRARFSCGCAFIKGARLWASFSSRARFRCGHAFYNLFPISQHFVGSFLNKTQPSTPQWWTRWYCWCYFPCRRAFEFAGAPSFRARPRSPNQLVQCIWHLENNFLNR